jgi:membrane protease YdiL (CAAX protease family)
MTVPKSLTLPVFFLVLLVGAMVLGPLLYWALELVWPIPFHRAMDRALLISAVAALGLFWARIPLATLWPLDGEAWKKLLLGYFVAAVSIQAMIGFGMALCGFTSSHLTGSQAMGRVFLALIAALIAPPLEETIFRGFIQRELVQGVGTVGGLILAAALFTLAHFIKIPVELDHQAVYPWSGVTALGSAFASLGEGRLFSGQGLNLFLVGLILGGFFLRAGSLWLNAGLHSGWIFGLLLFTGFERPVEPPRVAYFGGDILSSLATTLVLILTGIWLWRYYRHPFDLSESGRNAH